jgi:hypothetical protein
VPAGGWRCGATGRAQVHAKVFGSLATTAHQRGLWWTTARSGTTTMTHGAKGESMVVLVSDVINGASYRASPLSSLFNSVTKKN